MFVKYVGAGTSAATAGNATTSNFPYADAENGSQSSVDTSRSAISKEGLTAGCTPSAVSRACP